MKEHDGCLRIRRVPPGRLELCYRDDMVSNPEQTGRSGKVGNAGYVLTHVGSPKAGDYNLIFHTFFFSPHRPGGEKIFLEIGDTPMTARNTFPKRLTERRV